MKTTTPINQHCLIKRETSQQPQKMLVDFNLKFTKYKKKGNDSKINNMKGKRPKKQFSHFIFNLNFFPVVGEK